MLPFNEVHIRITDKLCVLNQLLQSKEELKNLLKDLRVKFYIILKVKFSRKEQTQIGFFKSTPLISLGHNVNELLDDTFGVLDYKVDEWTDDGFGWLIDEILEQRLCFTDYNPLL